MAISKNLSFLTSLSVCQIHTCNSLKFPTRYIFALSNNSGCTNTNNRNNNKYIYVVSFVVSLSILRELLETPDIVSRLLMTLWRTSTVSLDSMGVNGLSYRRLSPSSSAWQLPVPLLSTTSPLWASSTQNYATASFSTLWKSFCSSRAIWQPSTIYYRWLSMSRQKAEMKINKTLFFWRQIVFLRLKPLTRFLSTKNRAFPTLEKY